MLRSATALLAKFISTREPNIKYLGLETLMRLVEVPAVVETIDKCGVCNFALITSATTTRRAGAAASGTCLWLYVTCTYCAAVLGRCCVSNAQCCI